MRKKAVIDRLETDLAVILVGDEERVLTIPRNIVPDGGKEGDWLSIELDGSRVTSAAIDREATDQARERIAEKLARLRARRRP